MKEKVAVCWFRRDLRLDDHVALYHAQRSGLPVVPFFIFDRDILDRLEAKSDARVHFIHHALQDMNDQLALAGSSMHIYYGKVLEAWERLTGKYEVCMVMANEDYEPEAKERDNRVAAYLSGKGVPFNLYKDQVIFNPEEILKDNGTPYTIFTPYKNRWRMAFGNAEVPYFNCVKRKHAWIQTRNTVIPSLESMGFKTSRIDFASGLLDKSILRRYAIDRDFPSLQATSKLSVHLRFGTLSIRRLVKEAFDISETWINELIWREFYMMILWHFPHVVHGAFKPVYNRIAWRNNEAEFERWCNGQTGYPIVDAGMRELKETGFMHNRLRMVTAGFLTRHLLIDWQWGASWFANHLVDFELSSNNGGWQWAAGTGCDAAPYFRIFNPWEQTRKFDPRHDYIRKWVPEFESAKYPVPMVEHSFARARCLAAYKKALAL